MAQSWDPERYQQAACFVPTLGEPLLDLLNPRPGMRILDVGCGNGTLTRKLIERGADVIGIDASPSMVDAARRNGIDAYLADAHEMDFSEAFHAVFSNAALHWMTRNPGQVVQNIYQALKPGGRFVAEMGCEGNIAIIRACMQEALQPFGLHLDALSPKFFPSEMEYRQMLEDAGFTVELMTRFERPTPLPEGIRGWLSVFAVGVLNALADDEREPFIQRVEALAKPRLYGEQGWWADYVRLRFVALKPIAA